MEQAALGADQQGSKSASLQDIQKCRSLQGTLDFKRILEVTSPLTAFLWDRFSLELCSELLDQLTGRETRVLELCPDLSLLALCRHSKVSPTMPSLPLDLCSLIFLTPENRALGSHLVFTSPACSHSCSRTWALGSHLMFTLSSHSHLDFRAEHRTGVHSHLCLISP